MILRNTRFHFAHEISAHISSLRVNAATHTGEQSDR